jgi:hypothetical protein
MPDNSKKTANWKKYKWSEKGKRPVNPHPSGSKSHKEFEERWSNASSASRRDAEHAYNVQKDPNPVKKTQFESTGAAKIAERRAKAQKGADILKKKEVEKAREFKKKTRSGAGYEKDGFGNQIAKVKK